MYNNSLTFNVNDGELEALVHGYRAGLLKEADYNNLTQCNSLDDVKLHLSSTDYGNFLQSEPSPLTSAVITKKATEVMVTKFNEVRFQAVEPLSTFLDYITFDYMISNVLKLITAIRDGSKALSLMYKCHPLGMFEGMSAITAASSVDEMYELVLVDSPIGPFFTKTDKRDFDEFTTDYIRALLQKNYLESFYDYCQSLGGITKEVMTEILNFEADRAVLTITTQSFGSKDLPKDERIKLYPNFGELVDIHEHIADADDDEALKKAVKPYRDYFNLLNSVEPSKPLENILKKKHVELCKDAFIQQYQYSMFYSYIHLKEQEIKNIYWISECIKQDQKGRIGEYISIY